MSINRWKFALFHKKSKKENSNNESNVDCGNGVEFTGDFCKRRFIGTKTQRGADDGTA